MSDTEIARQINRCHFDAVIALRRRVEQDGEDWERALSAVIGSHRLGLAQIADIEAKARERYGQKEAAMSRAPAFRNSKPEEASDMEWQDISTPPERGHE